MYKRTDCALLLTSVDHENVIDLKTYAVFKSNHSPPLCKPVRLWLNWDPSLLPSAPLPPIPRYWAFCSASNVFIRRLAANQGEEGSARERRSRQGKLSRREETLCWCFELEESLLVVCVSSFNVKVFTLRHRPLCSPGLTMTRPATPWVGLILLLIGYAAAGKVTRPRGHTGSLCWFKLTGGRVSAVQSIPIWCALWALWSLRPLHLLRLCRVAFLRVCVDDGWVNTHQADIMGVHALTRQSVCVQGPLETSVNNFPAALATLNPTLCQHSF